MRAWWLLLLVGCRSGAPGPYSPTDQAARNTVRAQELSRQAADLIDSDPQAAERLLREALGADLFYGPAHNNLGVLLLKEGKLYEAAGEFEWARKLMPGHPDPRMNLALTLEQAGQVDEAIQAYETALEVYPGHIPTVQALARLHVQRGRDCPDLDGWLDAIALQGETQDWRAWAQQCRRREPRRPRRGSRRRPQTRPLLKAPLPSTRCPCSLRQPPKRRWPNCTCAGDARAGSRQAGWTPSSMQGKTEQCRSWAARERLRGRRVRAGVYELLL